MKYRALHSTAPARLLLVAVLALLLGTIGVGAAAADSTGPIDFEAGYSLGTIDGQQGWSKSGSYDVAVASVAAFPAAAGYGFGAQALRLSDAVASGSFGDQTFSPGLSEAAGESGQTHFDASFKIGTTSASEQAGLHMAVSPDNGSGARMSYLRFEDQADGVHVFFVDVTDAGPFYTQANFNETEIATLSRTIAHTVAFAIDFKSGPGNDVVKITIDGVLKATGTTWEDYYRYDNENQGAAPVPAVSKLLFRESGAADPSNAGNGFLVDAVSLASSMTPRPCIATGLQRDGLDLTAARVNPAGTISGAIDASGCNIGVYYGPGHSGSVSNAEVFGANYYGVVADGAAVNIANSAIHDIGESPLNGSQHGVGVLYTTIHQDGSETTSTATGTLSGSTFTNYQKGGVVVSGSGAAVNVLGNTLSGQGPVPWIAQNGIQISFGATALVSGNTVSGNWYSGQIWTSCGLLFYQTAGVRQQDNSVFDNQKNLCNVGRGGGQFNP